MKDNDFKFTINVCGRILSERELLRAMLPPSPYDLSDRNWGSFTDKEIDAIILEYIMPDLLRWLYDR